MEDKFVVTVPSRYYSSTKANTLAVSRSNGSFFGPSCSGAQALSNNIAQFLLGAPVVDYNSIEVVLNDNASATAILEVIDTSVTRADSLTRPVVSTSSAYSNFSDRLYQNLDADTRSSAVGNYRIYLQQNTFFIQGNNPSGTNITLRDSGGSALHASYGTTTPDAAQTHDFYDDSGNFVFCVGVMDATGFGTGTGDYINFTVEQPEYTEAYNWAEITRTTRTDSKWNNSNHSVLFFDGKRGSTTDPTDPLSDYDMQGLSMIAWNADVFFLPVATVSNNQGTCNGGFWDVATHYSTGNNIFSSMDAGRSFNNAGGTANFNPNKFTLIRGHGYIRILSQVADMPSGTVNATYADRDECHFFGMFKPYETMEEYPHPMAFFGKVGGVSSRTGADSVRPFWRASRGTLHEPVDDIWSLNRFLQTARDNGQFTAMMPFILSREFLMESTPSGTYNLPVYVKMLQPVGQPLPLLNVIDTNAAGLAHADEYQGVDNIGNVTIGSADDSRRVIALNFDTRESVGWDPVIGYNSPAFALPENMGNPGGTPNIEPLRMTQLSGDHHTWTYQDGTAENGTVNNAETVTNFPTFPESNASVVMYENIGELPGMYWGPEIDYMTDDPTTPAVTYPAGSEFTIDNRTYRMVIGHNSNVLAHFNVVDGQYYTNFGNLYFDLNAL